MARQRVESTQKFAGNYPRCVMFARAPRRAIEATSSSEREE
jgi:hypothetical protein